MVSTPILGTKPATGLFIILRMRTRALRQDTRVDHFAGEDIEEEVVQEPETPLDMPGYDEETRALYAGGLSEVEPGTEDTMAE